jgi:hypothetical protein
MRRSTSSDPIREGVLANLRVRGQPAQARVDLTDAIEDLEEPDRQRNPLYGNRKTSAPPARNS